MVRVGYLWHGPSCEVALQVKNTKGKGGINTVNALAVDDNRPPYEMAKPSKVCDVHTIDTDSTTKCSNNPMLPYKYSDPGTPIIKAYTLTRNDIAGSASHIGHAAHSSGVQLGIEPSCTSGQLGIEPSCSSGQLGLGLSFLGARWGLNAHSDGPPRPSTVFTFVAV
jgi:hypothetical protein